MASAGAPLRASRQVQGLRHPLSFGNHQARLLRQQLRNQKIPYVLSGGQSFFDKTEIKGHHRPTCAVGQRRRRPGFIRAATTPRRGIGATTLKCSASTPASAMSRCSAPPAEALRIGVQSTPDRPPLLAFCQFIGRLRQRAGREPAAAGAPGPAQGHRLQSPSPRPR